MSIRFFIVSVLVLLVSVLLVVYYATRPGIPAKDFPEAGILNFADAQIKEIQIKGRGLKAVSFNLGYASGKKNNQGLVLIKEEVQKNLKEAARVLKTYDADLIFIQEIDFYSKRTFYQNQLEFLAHELKFPFAAYVVSWNQKYVPWPYWPPKLHYGRIVSGQAILSRFPILKQTRKVFAKPRENPFWYNWFYLDRVLQKVVLQVEEKNFFAYNVHLEAFAKGSRLQQLQEFAGIILKDKAEYKIVAGDFNMPLRELGGFLKETGLKTKEAQATYPSWDPQKDINQFMVSPNLEIVSTGTLQLEASDHLPLTAKIR